MSITKFNIWTTKPGEPINELIKVLKPDGYIQSSLSEEATRGIVNGLLNEGYKIASDINSQSFSNNTDKSEVGIDEPYSISNGFKGSVYLYGTGAVYDEFGTGEEGASNPHPMKNNFGLNAYNSGSYVSTHINPYNGRHYWIYPPMSGQPYFDLDFDGSGYTITGYTEGVPSGKQIYTALQHIRKIKGEIIAEELNDALRILK